MGYRKISKDMKLHVLELVLEGHDVDDVAHIHLLNLSECSICHWQRLMAPQIDLLTFMDAPSC